MIFAEGYSFMISAKRYCTRELRFEKTIYLRGFIAIESPASKKVQARYEELLRELGSELSVLRQIPLEELSRLAGPCVAGGGRRLRRAGADGAYFLRSVLALGAELGVYALGMASAVNLAAALYFSQLLSNTLLAWTVDGARRHAFALGLTLFVGCDVCVGLFNALPPASPLYFPASVGMWLFYLPSQALIALSAFPGKENVK